MLSFSEQIFIQNAPLIYQFFKQMKDLIFLMSVEQDGGSIQFRYELMNEAAFHSTGMTEESYGKTIEEVFPNEFGQFLHEQTARAVQTKQPVIFEDKIRNTDYYGESIIHPIFDEQGNCTHIFTLVRDISRRRDAERELEINRQRYESLFYHHPDAVYTLDLEGKLLSANEAFKKVAGYSVNELLDKPLLPIVQPEYIAETIKQFHLAKQGQPQSYESAVIHQDGRRVDIDVQNIPIVTDGNIVGVYGIAKDITVEKEQREALREVKEQLETFWQNTTEAVFMLDRNCQILKANKAFEKMFGVKEQELIGKDPKDPQLSIVPDFMNDERQEIIARLLRGERIVSHETKRMTREGRLLDILASYSPIYDKKGTVLGTTAFYRDITERKLAEEELKQSEEKYRLIAENMTDLIAIVDPDLKVTYASPSYLTVLGVNPIDYEKNIAGNLVDAAYQKAVLEKYKELMETKRPVAFEAKLELNNPEGLPLFVETFANPILDAHGHIEKILCVSRDVSRRKLIEEALKESEERFRLIAENTLDVIKLLDPNGIHTYASPSHQIVLGFEPSDYLGKTIFMDTHPEDFMKLQQAFVRLTLSKAAEKVVIRKQTAGGEWIWMDASMTPVLTKEGRLNHILVVSRDVTDHMEHEKLLQYMAYHDSLTGLPNRRLIMSRLEQLIASNREGKKTFAVLVLDCDHFKDINDSLGHDYGDQVIKGFARRLQSCIRESDVISGSTTTVSRLGGDEFVILLQDLREEAHALNIAERILEAIREPWNIEGVDLRITTSIGVAFFNGTDCLDPKKLIKRADFALYQAKEAGRNTYTVYGEPQE